MGSFIIINFNYLSNPRNLEIFSYLRLIVSDLMSQELFVVSFYLSHPRQNLTDVSNLKRLLECWENSEQTLAYWLHGKKVLKTVHDNICSYTKSMWTNYVFLHPPLCSFELNCIFVKTNYTI